MNPFAAVAIKVMGGSTAAAVLSMGVATSIAAATPSPSPTSPASHTQRHAVAAAVLESEADVLGITPADLRKDLKAGQKVSDLARDKGITQEQFEARLDATLKPMLEKLVEAKVITQKRADRILDRIARGHIPWWDGIHKKK